MRIFNLLIILLFAVITSACNSDSAKQPITPKVVVSIIPEKYLVKKIAEDTLEVEVLVPPGASPHTFEPSPHKVISTAKASIWFRIGENFETKVIQAFQSHNPNIKIIDLREGVDLLPLCCGHHHIHLDKDAHDSHIWLSPRLLIIMAELIKDALVETYPEQSEKYQKNFESFAGELVSLDQEFYDLFENSPQRSILVSHPAFAYFCRDYHLNQLSIEVEGKDPTVKQLTQLLEKAKNEQIRFVFMQEQYNTKGAQLIAEQLQAETMLLDPYAEDVVENLRKIASAFSRY